MAQLIECEDGIKFRNITHGEIRYFHEMESENFPKDEADSYDTFIYRQREAPDLLLGCYLDGCLVGFISAVRYHGKELTKESMKIHEPDGESVCIHSVVVQERHRKKVYIPNLPPNQRMNYYTAFMNGFALKMLHVFVDKVTKDHQDVSRILLICKSNLIPFYKRAGFVLNGRSNVVHGKDPWYELQIPISGR